jgi:hypothetical protein
MLLVHTHAWGHLNCIYKTLQTRPICIALISGVKILQSTTKVVFLGSVYYFTIYI